MQRNSALRIREHEFYSSISLDGKVLDLGGVRNSEYSKLLGGSHTIVAVNLDAECADIVHDLEKPLPFENGSYDAAVLNNVLEHVYDFRQLLEESVRVLKPGGTLVVVAPFLFPYHASPNDYWRFSRSALEKEMTRLGVSDVRIQPLADGLFTARLVLIERVFPNILWSLLVPYVLRPLALCADGLMRKLAQWGGRAYNPADYAAGHAVTAIVPRRAGTGRG